MANNNSINLANQITIDDISYEGPLANQYGGKYAKVVYNGKWLLLQIPKSNVPFGLNVYEDTDKTGKTIKRSYSLDVSFNGLDSNTKMEAFYNLIKNMEKKLIKHATKNSFTWVGDDDATEPVCKALLRSSIKWSRDKNTKQINKKYPPRLKLSLPVYDDEMKFKAYLDNKNNPITNIEELVKLMSGRCEIIAIIKCDKITFNGGKYGYKWSVQQLKLYSTSSQLSKYAFVDDSDDEDKCAEINKVEVPAKIDSNNIISSDDSDSSASDSDDDEITLVHKKS